MSRVLTLGFVLACGCCSAQTPNGRYQAVGAESLDQAVQLWRDLYRATAPDFKLDVHPEGSNAAPKALLEGRAQFALMSREMKPEEVAAFQTKKGYAPTRITVAMDALVVLVNKNNPIKELRLEQLDAAYSSTRALGWPKDISRWGDLGLTDKEWATRPIVRWQRPLSSGTRSFFQEAVLRDGKLKPDTREALEEGSLTEELITNQAAIGYGSMSGVFTSLKAVPIIPVGGKRAMAPTVENVASGAYPLSRFLFVYIDKAPGKALPAPVEGFLATVLSPKGQQLLKNNGQAPLPEELLKPNRRRLIQ